MLTNSSLTTDIRTVLELLPKPTAVIPCYSFLEMLTELTTDIGTVLIDHGETLRLRTAH